MSLRGQYIRKLEINVKCPYARVRLLLKAMLCTRKQQHVVNVCDIVEACRALPIPFVKVDRASSILSEESRFSLIRIISPFGIIIGCGI